MMKKGYGGRKEAYAIDIFSFLICSFYFREDKTKENRYKCNSPLMNKDKVIFCVHLIIGCEWLLCKVIYNLTANL